MRGKKVLEDWTAGGTFTAPAQIGVNDAFLMRLSIPTVKVVPHEFALFSIFYCFAAPLSQ